MGAAEVSSSKSTHTQPRRRRRRRWLVRLLILALIALVAGELFCRFYLGLGDPPLIMPDPQIEYVHPPSTSYRRFGHRVRFNSFSMRSDEFPARKSLEGEWRIILMGDSIVNGGGHTDQSELASELLRDRLAAEWDRPIVVGNVSAGSWGPPNLLAYVEKHGLFGADQVILVLSSQDAGDLPTFDLSSAGTPTRKPLLATAEFLQRYVPQMVKFLADGRQITPSAPPSVEDVDASMDALRRLIDLARSQGADVAVLLHWKRTEITDGRPESGLAHIRNALDKRNVPIIDMQDRLRRAMMDGREPYRDYTHPNALGQRLMCDAVFDWLVTPRGQ